MTMLVAPISTRNCFGQLLNGMGLLGEAVEVGTHRAQFAVNFLGNWKGRKLWCVDPWNVPEGYEAQAKLLESGNPQDRFKDFERAVQVLAIFEDRAETMRLTSKEAAGWFDDGSLDFVHLDGDHEEPSVTQDIALWWPKIKPGGVLAGHDFVCPGPPGRADDWGRFIQPAVLRFAESLGVDANLVVEEGGLPWSYYLIKPSDPAARQLG